jgi:two-component sensor histidine kinase
MNASRRTASERALVLTPLGRDAQIAAAILAEAGLASTICPDLATLVAELDAGAGVALVVEELLHERGYADLARWLERQPPWSDFPILVLTQRGPGLERNPAAARLSQTLGNVTFLERPFHPTTLVSMVQTALRGRRRQYEASDRLEALRSAVLRQERDQEHLRLMVNELNHRVKNTLATVQSIVAHTLRGADAPERLRETLTSRILALSKAHDVLTDEQWSGADLREIARQAAAPYRAAAGQERFVLAGPTVLMPPKTAIAIALAFHELATNAVKYGALSTEEGQVELSWTLRREADHQALRIVWRETGGPAVSPPTRSGFGTRLIQRGLAADLQGRVLLEYPASGAVCTIEATLADDAEPPSPGAKPAEHRSFRPSENVTRASA